MTEAQITSELVQYLKRVCPVVMKHADRATIGMPDMSVTSQKKTVWLEVKLFKKSHVTWGEVCRNKLQHEVMRDLATHGWAWYVVFVNYKKLWYSFVADPIKINWESCQVLQLSQEGKRFDRVLRAILNNEESI